MDQSGMTPAPQASPQAASLSPIQPTVLVKKRHPVLKFFAWFFGIIILLVVILISIPSVLGLFYKDIPPIDDSDLSLVVVSVSDEQNALPDLVLASKVFDERAASNTVALTHFADAAKKSLYQDPAYANPANISVNNSLPAMGPWRKIASTSNALALSMAKEGKALEALQQALAGVSVGNKLAVSQNAMIGWLLGVAIENQSLETVQKIISSSTLTSDNLKFLASGLSVYPSSMSGLVKSTKGQYYESKNVIKTLTYDNIDRVNSGKSVLIDAASKIDRTNFYLHPNHAISLFADDARRHVKIFESSCDSIGNTEVYTPDQVMDMATPNLLFLYVTPDAIGIILHGIIVASSGDVKHRQCDQDVLLSATRILAALGAYKLDNKKIPDSLSMLVPAYLADMPLDPYSGKEFVYSPAKRIIYSVGQEQKDVGGSTGEQWDKMKNPTFNINF